MVNYTVIGAGQGGHAAAGHIKLRGHNVKLWNRPGEKIEYLKKNPTISLEGKLNGSFELDTVTDDIEEAIHGSDIITVMTRADLHEDLATKLAPFLKDNQMILLNGGGIGGSLLFHKTINSLGYNPKIIVGETDTCVYGCKVPKIGQSLIKSIKKNMLFSSIPNNEHSEHFLNKIKDIYPQFNYVNDPFMPGFSDGTTFHTAGMVLNQNRIANKENFNFYIEGITKDIAKFMEEMDQERISTAKALGLNVISEIEWLNKAYGIPISDLHTMLQKNEPYKYNAPAPKTFQHRYLVEEIPTKIIPQLEIGEILGIKQPLTKYIADEACKLTQIDFYKTGRNIEKLGLTKEDIINYSKQGIKPYLQRNLM